MHAGTTSKSEMEIGAKLGAIIQDTASREHLVENPSEVLDEIGVKADVTIYADTADLVHLIVPAEIDAHRVETGDESYFEELGRLALGTCMYDDIPE